MGNRAVVTTGNGVGVYLHWNGGPESILAFIEVCNQRDYRTPGGDEFYAMARFVGVCHEFFESGLSLGIGPMNQLDKDNGDNGVYTLGPGWEIKKRSYKGPKSVEELGPRELEQYRGIVAKLTGHRADPPE